MKNYSAIICAFFVCLTIASLEARPDASSQNERFTQIAPVIMVFPPMPTNLIFFPYIGPPNILLSSNILNTLGGADVTNMAAVFIRDLLIKSKRFTVTDSNRDYVCQVQVTDLDVNRQTNSSGTSPSGIVGSVIDAMGKLIPTNFIPLVNNTDWLADEDVISFRCSLSLNIVSNGVYLASGNGTEDEDDTTVRNIRMEFAGFTETNDIADEQITDMLSLKSHLVELAAYSALTNMLPDLDMRLLQIQTSQSMNTLPQTVEQRLELLNELLAKHLITQEDYDKKKQEILNSL